MQKITIIVVDDHQLIRQTWAYTLNADPRFSVLADCETAEEGIKLCKELHPHLILLDINLTGITGIEAIPLIRKYSLLTKILGVSLHTQPGYAKKMIQEGASGYVTKNSTRQEMFNAIISVHAGKKYICDEISDNIIEINLSEVPSERSKNLLSLREMHIIDLIKKGFSSKEIADQSHISVKTVETHRYNILRKLNLKNSAALINYIHQNNYNG